MSAPHDDSAPDAWADAAAPADYEAGDGLRRRRRANWAAYDRAQLADQARREAEAANAKAAVQRAEAALAELISTVAETLSDERAEARQLYRLTSAEIQQRDGSEGWRRLLSDRHNRMQAAYDALASI